ncbi:36411_t:CDS:1 [Gigaspora margarita]|uniref:36411_t:CDS:1 n=1 Tax=Gigaspora margarita TaxID=4874 RepID=A0ABN7UDX3_GIGMA|nr:36411_t:CDS:1 [Gigaspora margarita]
MHPEQVEGSADLYDTKRQRLGFDLERVRPIALLEAFHKYVTKEITKRLSKVFIEKNILQDPNFTSLPEDSTKKPFYILNVLLEEAQKKRKNMAPFSGYKKGFNLLILEKAL